MSRQHSHMWDDLDPEVQAAIDRQLAKMRPISEWPADKARRLAAHLGLTKQTGGDADAAA